MTTFMLILRLISCGAIGYLAGVGAWDIFIGRKTRRKARDTPE